MISARPEIPERRKPRSDGTVAPDRPTGSPHRIAQVAQVKAPVRQAPPPRRRRQRRHVTGTEVSLVFGTYSADMHANLDLLVECLGHRFGELVEARS